MSTPPPLRLGRIDFINVIPVHRHVKPSPGLFEEVRAVPSRLNQLIRAGELDLAAVSSVEYARAAEQYLILADLGLSTFGAVDSVLLLSGQPMEAWAGGEVEVPYESETSVALLQLFLRRLWGVDCRLMAEGTSPEPVAVLRIGNRALKEKASGRWPHIWDMGQVWWQWTGLPLVYALWVVRQEVARQRPTEVGALHQVLLRARDQGLADVEGCAQEAAQVMGGRPGDYTGYFQALKYTLDPHQVEGLQRFYALLYEEGLLPAPVCLRFFPS